MNSRNKSMNGGFSYGDIKNLARPQPSHDMDYDYDAQEQHYLYKAKKYHYKCQAKLRSMMAEGKQCPEGFEKYLKPFSY